MAGWATNGFRSSSKAGLSRKIEEGSRAGSDKCETLMKLPVLKFQLGLILILAAIAASAAALFTWLQTPSFYFEVSMRSSTPGLAQTFYDSGGGFREEDSARQQLHDPGVTAVYRFPLPELRYRVIRFDPLEHGNADLVIDSIRIIDISGRAVRTFPLQEATVQGGISFSQIKDGKLFLTLGPEDKDSILIINPGTPFSLHLSGSLAWLFALRVFSVWFLPLTILGAFWVVAAEKLFSGPTQQRWSKMRGAAERHPHATLLLTAALATIISCHPVVFCGRSFVSPNNASLLYPNSPTVPGYQNSEFEDFKNSDTGATMWQNVPYSFVQYRSLAQYRELPLWNRFHSSGTPLLGQGLSMFGDPLHLMVVAAGGSARAWDVKFLLAKFLFCSALGLLVFAAVRHLPVALLLTASAAWLGFFSDRFDHPAFFSMCYAPWILYCWLRVKEATTSKSAVAWIVGLMVASWSELNSGTVKEAYMLLLGMNGCGLLVLVLDDQPPTLKFKKLAHLTFGGLLFIAISMPVWLTFLDALRIAFTVYSPTVWNIQPSLFIGMFDDIFYRQLTLGESVYTPSVNFFILVGFSLALGHCRDLVRDPVCRAVAISALIAFSMAFAVVPPSLLVKIPFVGNIVHIGNTFSCVLIVYLFILAGFGFRAFWRRIAGNEWKTGIGAAFLVLSALLALYFGFVQANDPLSPALSGRKVSFSPFFDWYAPSLFIGAIALPFIARNIARHPVHRTIAVPLLFACLFLLHWRHGFYLKTGLAQIDDYVINPLVRANLSQPSPAVQFVTAQPGIYRAAGFGAVLFPGYNALAGVESIYGTDPLANPYYRELLQAGGVKQDWNWRWIVEKATLEANLPLYSLLNVRYFLGLPQEDSPEMPSLRQIGSFDLRVLENDKAWPRAFFVDKVFTYETTAELLEMIRKGAPLAAVERKDAAALAAAHGLEAPSAGAPSVFAAKDFILTNNKTTFAVDASGPGVVVLTETYPDDQDFRVTMNGQGTKYFRVNHAFRGVAIPAAGKYTISFSYWPKHFTLSIVMFITGLVSLLVWLGITQVGSHPSRDRTSVRPETSLTEARRAV
jgi:hypothetical protein